MPAIAVADLEKTYATRDGASVAALGPISTAVFPHEFVSVVGPSGCGKSTLLKIVAGLIPRSAGSVQVEGAEVHAPRGDLGMVFQSPVLLPWKTVLQNVLLPVEINRLPLATYRGRALELLELVGLTGFADRYPNELSGGMQQRAGIVRALIRDPSILLMDEPFGALDAITRDQLNVELLRIWSRSPKTVLFITHGIPEAVFLSDRVIVMSGRPGRAVQDFRIDLPRPRTLDLLASPAFGETTARVRAALERGMARA